jgi:hypothetical protein
VYFYTSWIKSHWNDLENKERYSNMDDLEDDIVRTNEKQVSYIYGTNKSMPFNCILIISVYWLNFFFSVYFLFYKRNTIFF